MDHWPTGSLRLLAVCTLPQGCMAATPRVHACLHAGHPAPDWSLLPRLHELRLSDSLLGKLPMASQLPPTIEALDVSWEKPRSWHWMKAGIPQRLLVYPTAVLWAGAPMLTVSARAGR